MGKRYYSDSDNTSDRGIFSLGNPTTEPSGSVFALEQPEASSPYGYGQYDNKLKPVVGINGQAVNTFSPHTYFNSFQDKGKEGALDGVDDAVMLSWAHSVDDANKYAMNIKSYRQKYDEVVNNYELDPVVREEASKYLGMLRKYTPETGMTLADAIHKDKSDEMEQFKKFQSRNGDIADKILELANLRRGLDSDKEQLVNEKMSGSMYGDTMRKQYSIEGQEQIPFAMEFDAKKSELDSLYGPIYVTNRRGELEINPERAKAEYDWLASKRAANGSFMGDSWLGGAYLKPKSFVYGIINDISSLIPGVPNANLKASSVDKDDTYDDDQIVSHMDQLKTVFAGLNDDNTYRDKDIKLTSSLEDPARKVYTVDKSIVDQYQAGMSISDYVRYKSSGELDQLDRSNLFVDAAEQPVKKWAGNLWNAFSTSGSMLQSDNLADLTNSIKYFAKLNPSILESKNGYDDDVSITPSGYVRDLSSGERWGQAALETLSMGLDMAAGGFEAAGAITSNAPKYIKALGKLSRASKVADAGIGFLSKVATPITNSRMMNLAMEGIKNNPKAANAFTLLTNIGKIAPETAVTFAIAHGLTDRDVTAKEMEESLISGAIFGGVSQALQKGFSSISSTLRQKLPGLNKQIDKEIQQLALSKEVMPLAEYENQLAYLKTAKVLEASKIARNQRVASLLSEAAGFPLASAISAAANAEDDKAQAFIDHLTSEQAVAEILQGIAFHTLMPHHNMRKEQMKLMGASAQEIAKMPDFVFGGSELYVSTKQALKSHREAKRILNDVGTHIENLYTPESNLYMDRVEAANEIMKAENKVEADEISENGEALYDSVTEDDMFPEGEPVEPGAIAFGEIEKPALDIPIETSSQPAVNPEELVSSKEVVPEGTMDKIDTAPELFSSEREVGIKFTGRNRRFKPVEEASDNVVRQDAELEPPPQDNTNPDHVKIKDESNAPVKPPEVDIAEDKVGIDAGIEEPPMMAEGDDFILEDPAVVPEVEAGNRIETKTETGASKTISTGDPVRQNTDKVIDETIRNSKKTVKTKNIFSRLSESGRIAREKMENFRNEVVKKATHATMINPIEQILFKDKDFEYTIEDAQKASLAKEYIQLVKSDPDIAKLVAFDVNGNLTSKQGASGRLLQKMIILNKFAGKSTFDHEKVHLIQKTYPGLANKILPSIHKMIEATPVLKEIANRYEQRFLQEAIDNGRIKNDRYYKAGRAKGLQKEISNRVAWEIAATMAENAFYDLPNDSESLSRSMKRNNDFVSMTTRKSQTSDWENIEVNPALIEILHSLRDSGIELAQNTTITDNTGEFKQSPKRYDSRADVLSDITDTIEKSKAAIENIVASEKLSHQERSAAISAEQSKIEAAQLAMLKFSGEHDNVYNQIKDMLTNYSEKYGSYVVDGVKSEMRKNRDLPRIMQELYGQKWDTEPDVEIHGESEHLLNRETYDQLDAEQKERLKNQYNGRIRNLDTFFDDVQASEKIKNMLPSDRMTVQEQTAQLQQVAALFKVQNDYNQQQAALGSKTHMWMNDKELKRFTVSTMRKMYGDAGYTDHFAVTNNNGHLSFDIITPEKSKFMNGTTVTASRKQSKKQGYSQFLKEVNSFGSQLPFESAVLESQADAFGKNIIPMAMSFKTTPVLDLYLDKGGINIHTEDGKVLRDLEDGEVLIAEPLLSNGKTLTFRSSEAIQVALSNGQISPDSFTFNISTQDGKVAFVSDAKNIATAQMESGTKLLVIGDNSTVATDMSKYLQRLTDKGILVSNDRVKNRFCHQGDVLFFRDIDGNHSPLAFKLSDGAVKRIGNAANELSKIETQHINMFLCSDNVFGMNMDQFKVQANGKTYNILDYVRYSNKDGKPAVKLIGYGKDLLAAAKVDEVQWSKLEKMILSKVGQDGQYLKMRNTIDHGNFKGSFTARWGGIEKTKMDIRYEVPMTEVTAGRMFDVTEDGKSYKYLKVVESDGNVRLMTLEEGTKIHDQRSNLLERTMMDALNEKLSLKLLGTIDMLQMRILDPSMAYMTPYERKSDGSISIVKATEKYMASMFREGESLNAKTTAAIQQAVYGDSANELFTNGVSNSPFIHADNNGDWTMKVLYMDQAADMLKTYFPNNPDIQEYFKDTFNDAGTHFTCPEAQQAFAKLAGHHQGMSLKNEYVCYNGGTKIHIKHAMHNPGLDMSSEFFDYYTNPAVAELFETLAKNGIGAIVPSTATKMGGVYKYNTVNVDGKEYYHNGKRIVGRNDNGKLVVDDDPVSKGDFLDRSSADGLKFKTDDNGNILGTFDLKLSGKDAVKHMPQFTTLSTEAYAFPQTIYELQSPEAAKALDDLVQLNSRVDIGKIQKIFSFLSGFKTEGDQPTTLRDDAESAAHMKEVIELIAAKADDKIEELTANPAPGETADVEAYRYAAKLLRSLVPEGKVDVNKLSLLIVKSGLIMCDDSDIGTLKKSPHVPQLLVQALGHMVSDAVEQRFGGTKATLNVTMAPLAACANGVKEYGVSWLKQQGIEGNLPRIAEDLAYSIIPTIGGTIDGNYNGDPALLKKFKDHLVKQGIVNPDGTLPGIDHKTGLFEPYGDICVVSSDYVKKGIVKFNDKIFTGIMPHDTQESVLAMRVAGILPEGMQHNLCYNQAMMIESQGRDLDIDSGCIFNPKIKALKIGDKALAASMQEASDRLWNEKHDVQQTHKAPSKTFINKSSKIVKEMPVTKTQQYILDGEPIQLPATNWFNTPKIVDEYMSQHAKTIESDLPHMPKGLSFEEQKKYLTNILSIHPSVMTFGRNSGQSINDVIGTENYTKNPYKYKQSKIGPMTAALSNSSKIIQRLYDPANPNPKLLSIRIPILKPEFADPVVLQKRLDQVMFEMSSVGKEEGEAIRKAFEQEIMDYRNVDITLNFDRQSLWQSLGKEGSVDNYTALGINTENPSDILSHMFVDNIGQYSTYEFKAISRFMDSLVAQFTPPMEQTFKRAKMHGRQAQLPVIDKMRGLGKNIRPSASITDVLYETNPSFKNIAKTANSRATLNACFSVSTPDDLQAKMRHTGLSNVTNTLDSFVRAAGVSRIKNDPAMNKMNYVKMNPIESSFKPPVMYRSVETKDGPQQIQTDFTTDLTMLLGKMEQVFSNRGTGDGINIKNQSYTPPESVTMAMLSWMNDTADYTRSPIMKLGKDGYVYSSESPMQIALPAYKIVRTEENSGTKTMRYIEFSDMFHSKPPTFGQYELGVEAYPLKQSNGKHEIVFRFNRTPIESSVIDVPKLDPVEIPFRELLSTSNGEYGFSPTFNKLIDDLHKAGNESLPSRDAIADYLVNCMTHDYSQYNSFEKSAPMLTGEVGRNVDTKEAMMHKAFAKFPLFYRAELERKGVKFEDRDMFLNKIAGIMCNTQIGKEYMLNRNKDIIDDWTNKHARTPISEMSSATYNTIMQKITARDKVLSGNIDNFLSMGANKRNKPVSIYDSHLPNPLLIYGTNNKFRAHLDALGITPIVEVNRQDIPFDDLYNAHITDTYAQIRANKNKLAVPKDDIEFAQAMDFDGGEYALINIDNASIPAPYKRGQSYKYKDVYTGTKEQYHPVLRKLLDVGLDSPELSSAMQDYITEQAKSLTGIDVTNPQLPFEKRLAEMVGKYNEGIADNIDNWLDKDNPNRVMHLNNLISSLPRYLDEIKSAMKSENPHSRFWGHTLWNGIIKFNKGVKISILANTVNKMVVDANDSLFNLYTESGSGMDIIDTRYGHIKQSDGTALDFINGKMMTTLEQIHVDAGDKLLHYTNNFTEHMQSFVDNVFDHIKPTAKSNTASEIHDNENTVRMASALAHNADKLFVDDAGKSLFWIRNEQAKSGSNSDYTIVCADSEGKNMYADFVAHGEEAWNKISDFVYNNIRNNPEKRAILNEILDSQEFFDKANKESYLKMAVTSYLKSKLLLNGYVPGMINSFRATLQSLNQKYGDIFQADSHDFQRANMSFTSILSDALLNGPNTAKALKYYPQYFRTEGELHNYYNEVFERSKGLIDSGKPLGSIRKSLYNMADSFGIHLKPNLPDKVLLEKVQGKLPEVYASQKGRQWIDKIRPVNVLGERNISVSSMDSGIDFNVPMSRMGIWNYVEGLAKTFMHSGTNMLENMYHGERLRMEQEHGKATNIYHLEEMGGLYRTMRGDTFNYSTSIGKETNFTDIPVGTPLILNKSIEKFGDDARHYASTGYFIKAESDGSGDQVITLFNPNTSAFETIHRSDIELGLQGNSTYKTIEKYHRQLADLVRISIPENWDSLTMIQRNDQMRQNIYDNWNVNPKLAARRDKIARLVLNTTYVPNYKLISAGIKAGAGLLNLAICPPAAFPLFVLAGKDIVKYSTSILNRAIGNVVGAGRSEIILDGFMPGIKQTVQNAWDLWRNKEDVIQSRAHKVSLRTFTEDLLQANKYNTIGEKKLTTGSEIRQYEHLKKTVSDLNGLDKAFQKYSEGSMTEAEWMAMYDATADTVFRTNGATPEEVVHNLKKFYGYDPLTAEFLDRHGNNLAQLMDMKRQSTIHTFQFYSSFGNILPRTEEWSSKIAQDMGIRYAKDRGNNLSFTEQQALARAYREMSIGAYGITARSEFEASPFGQVFGLFRRYNQSMNNYIIREVFKGRKRAKYNAQAASLFDQFCADVKFTPDGGVYKPADYKLSGIMGMAAMGTVASFLPVIGTLILQQLLGDEDSAILNNFVSEFSGSTDLFKTAGQKNIATEVMTATTGILAGGALFQINSEQNIMNKLNRGEISLQTARTMMNSYFNNVGSSMGGVFVGMGPSTLSGLLHNTMSYIALNSMPGIEYGGAKVLADEQSNKITSNLISELLSLPAAGRAAFGIAKPIIEGVATAEQAGESYEEGQIIRNVYLGDVLGNAGVPGTTSQEDYEYDKKEHTRQVRKRSARKHKK